VDTTLKQAFHTASTALVTRMILWSEAMNDGTNKSRRQRRSRAGEEGNPSEEGALGGGRPADGPHEVGEFQDARHLGAALGLRRRALLLSLAPRLGHLVLRLLHRLGPLLLQFPLPIVTDQSRLIRRKENWTDSG
jgi:hypothetical protein